ncbi:DUF5312 domain-containing protein [Sphingomonas cannabina]|uniref:DUF5312 domain-containing protein n=1 Tax=Sphingomonas cannabina TaxID=2899123 RepID=UPI001F319421|nr:DUF5312 domain-containing protein [Sphingomonas cannabina]UIJ43710.1 DUF5312 domain-containing protein [Sphingomonas cannabina]
MSAHLIARLIAVGTPAELVAEVAMLAARAASDREALDDLNAADEERRERKREGNARRQREFRARNATSHGVTRVTRDTVEVTRDEREVTLSPPALDKESAPHTPLKEINLTPRTGNGRAREATRLPEDWQPERLGGETVSGEIIEQRGQEWARRAFESFRNHWRSANGPNARKRDWQATWANWVIEQDRRDGGTRTRIGGIGGATGGYGRPSGPIESRRRLRALHDVDDGCGDAYG